LAPRGDLKSNLDAGLWVLAGSLAGSRIGEIALNWEYYRQNLAQIFSLPNGGLTWVGGCLGGIAALLVYARSTKARLGQLADSLIPLGAALWVSAWLSCLSAGCAYGRPSEAWWALPGRDELGIISPRLPVQLAGACLGLAVTAIIERLHQNHRASGQAAITWLAGIGLILTVLSFFRADPGVYTAGLRLDTWAAAAMTIIAGTGLGFRFVSSIKKEERRRLAL
jgi:phosphatidylglycerol:prolipoprotein diacylglycerol transferase